MRADIAFNELRSKGSKLTIYKKISSPLEIVDFNGLKALCSKIYLSKQTRENLLNNESLATNSNIYAGGDLIN